MQRAYIVGDTGKAITVSLIRDNEEVFRKDFAYSEGKDKPSIIDMATHAAQALVRNSEFFTRA